MSTLLERISSNVKTRRLELDISQEKLAERIEKSSSFVGQLEWGETSMKIETFQKLVHSLGFDANVLLSDNELPADKVSDLCGIAYSLDEKKLDFLITFARLLQETDI